MRKYFVTICTRAHQPFFGEIIEGDMYLSAMGDMAHKSWLEIPNHFSHVDMDEFVIMPNHVHGIVVINEHATIVETQHAASLQLHAASLPASSAKL